MKLAGAILIIFACGGFGAKIAATHQYELRSLQKLIRCLDYMNCELQYHMTPLPELCRKVSCENSGVISQLFVNIANELEAQVTPDVYRCMLAALSKTPNMPKHAGLELEQLGRVLGRFDLDGQIKGIEAARQSSRYKMEELREISKTKLRGCQTLALCAGAALAILFI